jgi:hypothetical protein
VRRLAAALVLVLAGCGGRIDPGRIDPALATLIPADTVLLAGGKLKELPPSVRSLVAAQTGIELKQELWEVLGVSNGRDIVAMARGEFSDRGLEPRLDGAQRIPYRGYTLLGTEERAVVFMNATTAVGGPTAAVRAVLDGRDRSSGPPARLAALMRSIPREHQLWLAAAGGFRGLRLPGNAGNLGRVLSIVEELAAGARVETGAQGFASALCRSAGEAESLAGALRAFTALSGFEESVQVAAREQTVRVDFALSEEALRRLTAQ